MKKVLFVCRGNIGRSQVAEELYNQMHPGHGASAGTIVEPPNQRLSDRPGAVNAIIVMKEKGIDMSSNTSTQLTEEMLNDFDRVIVMSEPENIPDWLRNNPKFEYWEVEDMKDQDLTKSRELRDQIEKLIKERLS
jgi:protein-tyrosine-phosphatase